jgi:Peptidase A4 family
VRLTRLLPALAGALALAAPAYAGDPMVSANWSGYAVTGTNATTGASTQFTSVYAEWVEPNVTCTTRGTTYSAFWVGLGGYAHDAPGLEQIGTKADCIGNLATDYVPWYELAPAVAVRIRLKVFPGNRLAGSVAADGTTVTLRLENLSRGTFFAKRLTIDAPDVSSAEWIAEAPTGCNASGHCQVLPLAQFGHVSFRHAQTTGDGHIGTIGDPAWSPTPIWMITDPGFAGPLGAFTAGTGGVPSPLSPDGASFTVGWQTNVTPPGP